MKNKIKITKEEKLIEAEMELGNFNSSKTLRTLRKDIERYSRVAKATTAKNKTISIRISGTDLLKLKAIAIQEGIPYQTLISSSLHKIIAK